MRGALTSLGAIVFTALLIAAGCNDGADFGGLNLGSPRADGGKGAITNQSSTCGQTAGEVPTFEKLDPQTLPACAPACGGAHCVPADKIPQVARASFAACGGGFCIPDTLIRSGGAKPASCKSLNNADGVCLSVCVPLVAEHSDALPQANCAADERCAPCINPNDNQPTGACAIGAPVSTGPCVETPAGEGGAPPGAPKCPHEGPAVLDPNTLPACGAAGSGAHCLAASLISPPELKNRLDACPSGGFCVPDKLIATGGRFIPSSCTASGGAEGRCQSKVLPEVRAQAHLSQSSCDASERCVPCYNPVDGKDTGACKTSCDPGPTKPPVRFADCCGARGKCVPFEDIPSSLVSNLQADVCGGGSLCAPTENIDSSFVPPSCSGFSFVLGDYDGVCLSTCLNFGANDFALVQGTCDALHKCVSCTDLDGNPTGAPGCP